MSLKELFEGGGIIVLLMTLIQVVPVKVNPWSWVWKILKKAMKAIGRFFSAEIIEELKEVKENQTTIQENQETIRKTLNDHIKTDDDRHADGLRTAILRFNMELIRGIKHTYEDFSEVLRQIDEYEQYCQNHAKYQNSKAVYAIANIKDVYKERLQKRDFAKYEREED